jgi:hypothetical protein
MRRFNWQIFLGLLLVVLSAFFYLVHYIVFKDTHHIFIYMVGDVAFVPIEVLLVTLIIHRLLSAREKRSMLEKLNMVIGAFFSEVGTELLSRFADFDLNSDTAKEKLIVTGDWSEREFSDVGKYLRSYDYRIEAQKGDLGDLQSFLIGKRDFLLRLLENPNLLEHDSFTDLLWAVFHLTDELAHRADVKQLPDTDYEHLAGDIKRAYVSLISEWLEYMKHLKDSYPYLFSLAMRTNPLDRNASPQVK